MKYTTKAAEKSTVKITIKYDAEDWKNAQQKAYLKLRGKFAVNGFRIAARVSELYLIALYPYICI